MKIANPFSLVWSWFRARIEERRGLQSVRFKDRSANVESWIHYGNQKVANRDPKTRHDLEATEVNSSVYIATRAISDAVASLPVKIIGMETIGGVEREYEDQDHPANQIIKNPNPSISWIDVIRHMVKSYLGDGNAFLIIERVTGPNPNVEIWPRDPRQVKMMLSDTGIPTGYVIGSGTPRSRVYNLDQVVHIRDVDPANPFYGKSRINSVRVEIMMDYFANQFNSKFFEHGATLHLMFTPDHNLSDDQHEQLLEALTKDMGGVENAFKLFVNQFAGKFSNADIKHKDIAFGELLKHNREKIFGAYGLPPFRGGVMEYANYANALAQDTDFWNNTIKPILMVIEASMNKQLIWPVFGAEFQMQFDLSDVPALKGDPLKQSVEDCNYVKNGIKTPDEIREKLGLPPLPKEEPAEDEVPIPNEAPEKEDQKEAERVIHSVLREQYAGVAIALGRMTLNGSMMSMLIDPVAQTSACFDVAAVSKSMERTCIPLVKRVIVDRVMRRLGRNHNGGFDPLANKDIHSSLSLIPMQLTAHNGQTALHIQSLLADADGYEWPLPRLLKEVRKLFTYAQAQSLTSSLLTDALKAAAIVVFEEKRKGIRS